MMPFSRVQHRPIPRLQPQAVLAPLLLFALDERRDLAGRHHDPSRVKSLAIPAHRILRRRQQALSHGDSNSLVERLPWICPIQLLLVYARLTKS